MTTALRLPGMWEGQTATKDEGRPVPFQWPGTRGRHSACKGRRAHRMHSTRMLHARCASNQGEGLRAAVGGVAAGHRWQDREMPDPLQVGSSHILHNPQPLLTHTGTDARTHVRAPARVPPAAAATATAAATANLCLCLGVCVCVWGVV